MKYLAISLEDSRALCMCNVCMYVYIVCAYMCMCVYICMHVCMYVCVYVYMRTCYCVCMLIRKLFLNSSLNEQQIEVMH